MITQVRNQVSIGSNTMQMDINPQTGSLNASVRIDVPAKQGETEEPRRADLSVSSNANGKLQYAFNGNIDPAESASIFSDMKKWIDANAAGLIDLFKSIE